MTFTPTATGSRTGTLTVTDNSNGIAGSTQTFWLSGTGVAPVASGFPTGPLSFGNQLINATSTAQTVTLSNSGGGTLTVNGITGSANFALSNNCGTSRAAGASCTISVTFRPTATGLLSGSLTITDNALDSPQHDALSGTGQDFTLTTASGSSTSATVSAGQSATYTLSVVGQGGFNQSVSLTCAGAPSKSTCTVSPSTLTPGSSATNITVTVTTTAPSVRAPRSRPLPPARPLLPGPVGLVMLALALAAVVWTVRGWCQPEVSRRRATFLTLAAGLLLTLAMAACGGGGRNGLTTTPETPAGTYPLTVTGRSGSGSATVSHSMTLTLHVS